ncbi:glutathione S-transferase N-terminal domain-containing protein [Aquimonas voraii]|uniref:Glutathione S-transferase n=1 Tax=Aquimonas voraii TaxID=265719 RepID=A0A1G6RQJ8_9GAMM|nr:glutathione S-transferase N-terminal domain-containing protein [Aquimonas voraii]SDD06693.1 Glutathione S-transferase [Aquimonas voraii]
MQLIYSATSPYARKVRMLVIEKGLTDRVEVVIANPLLDPPELLAANPLAKVPALIVEPGFTLFDSPLLCAYLDSLCGPRLIPEAGPERWQVLRREALADGITDAAVSSVMEGRRIESQRSPEWLMRWRSAILRGVVELEKEADPLGARFDLGAIAAAAALAYLDFRLPQIDWRAQAPGLSAWLEAVRGRESFAVTVPPAA